MKREKIEVDGNIFEVGQRLKVPYELPLTYKWLSDKSIKEELIRFIKKNQGKSVIIEYVFFDGTIGVENFNWCLVAKDFIEKESNNSNQYLLCKK